MRESNLVAEKIQRLLHSHASKLELYARQWTHDPANCVQEVFIKLAGIDPQPDNSVRWLFHAVRNLAISQGRSEAARKNRERNYVDRSWFETDSRSEVDTEELQLALSAIPIEIREVIVAHIWGELSFTEIAELTGVAISTIQRRYRKGLGQLKIQLQQQCHD